LLEKVSPGAKFKPPPRSRAQPSKSKNGVDVEVQTVAAFTVKRPDVDPVRPEPTPDPNAGKVRPRECVLPDNSEAAEALRKRLLEAQRLLLALDNQTSALTKELKKLRIAHWEKQRYKCAKEREVRAFFAARPDAMRENGVDLQDELSAKQAELSTARQQAKHWNKQARHLDTELSQQIRGGSESSRSSSDDEKRPKTCSCGNAFMDDSEFCRKCGKKRGGRPNSNVVPPLPGLSGLSSNAAPAPEAAAPKAAAAAKAAADLDEAQEVSSEDIWSHEGGDESSSRSV